MGTEAALSTAFGCNARCPPHQPHLGCPEESRFLLLAWLRGMPQVDSFMLAWCVAIGQACAGRRSHVIKLLQPSVPSRDWPACRCQLPNRRLRLQQPHGQRITGFVHSCGAAIPSVSNEGKAGALDANSRGSDSCPGPICLEVSG